MPETTTTIDITGVETLRDFARAAYDTYAHAVGLDYDHRPDDILTLRIEGHPRVKFIVGPDPESLGDVSWCEWTQYETEGDGSEGQWDCAGQDGAAWDAEGTRQLAAAVTAWVGWVTR